MVCNFSYFHNILEITIRLQELDSSAHNLQLSYPILSILRLYHTNVTQLNNLIVEETPNDHIILHAFIGGKLRFSIICVKAMK